jgi:hypothetical protein
MKRRKPVSDVVYHISNTMRLPWIVAAGELRPSKAAPIDFLWASTNPRGDRTACFNDLGRSRDELYETPGTVELVRWTLPATGFIPWREIKRLSLGFTKQEIESLERSAREDWGEHGVDKWRLRLDPLPLSTVIKVEVPWQGRWTPVEATLENCIELGDSGDVMGFDTGLMIFYSWRLDDGRFTVPSRSELADMWDGE